MLLGRAICSIPSRLRAFSLPLSAAVAADAGRARSRPAWSASGRTVFDGTTVEEFKAHILGVLENVMGPQPQPDSGAARRRAAGRDRRHRRHERQPGLYRRPARSAPSLFARRLLARAHCRHHANRRDGRRHAQYQPPRRRRPARARSSRCRSAQASLAATLQQASSRGRALCRSRRPTCDLPASAAGTVGGADRHHAAAHRDAPRDGRIPRRGRRPGRRGLCRAAASCRCRAAAPPARAGHGDRARWRRATPSVSAWSAATSRSAAPARSPPSTAPRLRLRPPVLQPRTDAVPDDARLDPHAAAEPDDLVEARRASATSSARSAGSRDGHCRHARRGAADVADHARRSTPIAAPEARSTSTSCTISSSRRC